MVDNTATSSSFTRSLIIFDIFVLVINCKTKEPQYSLFSKKYGVGGEEGLP